MNKLRSLRNVAIAAALLAGTAACDKDNETRKQADRAAENVNDQVEDLREDSKDLAETAADKREDVREEANESAKDTVEDMNDLRDESTDTKLRRNLGVDDDRVVVRDRVVDTDDLREEAKDVDENARERIADVRDEARDSAKDVAEDMAGVGTNARELSEAQNEFEYRRMVRIQTLRGVHAVGASQPMLINSIATSYPLEASDRAKVNEKLQVFQMRVDEAGNMIQSLEQVGPADWEARNDAATKALERLEDAREDAWEELHDADLIDTTSMR